MLAKEAGNRLFPVIGLGMTAGSPVGSWLAGYMFGAHLAPPIMLCVAVVLFSRTRGR